MQQYQMTWTIIIYDIQQSNAWKEAYSKAGVFSGDPRGISLALCTDGVNPFAHNKVQYSMWPLMLSLLNLPRRMRNKFASILLVGIVPANGTKEPQDLNPYIDIFVNELLELCSSTLFDAYSKAPFLCKVEVLVDIRGVCFAIYKGREMQIFTKQCTYKTKYSYLWTLTYERTRKGRSLRK